MRKLFWIAILLLAGMNAFAQLVVDERLFYLSYENTPNQEGLLYFLPVMNGSAPMAPILISQDTFKDIHLPELPFPAYFTGELLASGKHAVTYTLHPGIPPSVLGIDSNVNAQRGFLAQGRRIYLCVDTPYFRIYGNQGLEYSLSETEVPDGFTDALYADPYFYVLYPDELRIINLNQPAQPAINLSTPKPFPFGGVNTWLHLLPDAQGQEKLHIVIEYYTALMRTSLIALDTSIMAFDSVFHYDSFSNYYRPLVADGKLYMENFDTHYDPLTDSVFFSTQPHWPLYHPVGHFPLLPSFYLHRADVQEVHIAVTPGNQIYTASLGKDVLKFSYWWAIISEARNAYDQPAPFQISAHSDGIHIQALNPALPLQEVCVYDIDGRLLLRKETPGLSSLSIDVKTSSRILIIALRNEEGWFYRKQAFIVR